MHPDRKWKVTVQRATVATDRGGHQACSCCCNIAEKIIQVPDMGFQDIAHFGSILLVSVEIFSDNVVTINVRNSSESFSYTSISFNSKSTALKNIPSPPKPCSAPVGLMKIKPLHLLQPTFEIYMKLSTTPEHFSPCHDPYFCSFPLQLHRHARCSSVKAPARSKDYPGNPGHDSTDFLKFSKVHLTSLSALRKQKKQKLC